MTMFCSLCGEEITAPQFYKGKPYGYSCYAKLTGSTKKDKRKFVEVDPVGEIPGNVPYFAITVNYNHKNYRIQGVIRDSDGNLHSQMAVFDPDGKIYMVTHDRRGVSLWKTIK